MPPRPAIGTLTRWLLKGLRAARLDNSHDAEVRKLLRVDLLTVHDLCLTAFDATDTDVF